MPPPLWKRASERRGELLLTMAAANRYRHLNILGRGLLIGRGVPAVLSERGWLSVCARCLDPARSNPLPCDDPVMTDPAKLSDAQPRLCHTPSSYYSMIARLALA